MLGPWGSDTTAPSSRRCWPSPGRRHEKPSETSFGRSSARGLADALAALRDADAPPPAIDRIEEALEVFCELFGVDRPATAEPVEMDPDEWPFLFYCPLPRMKVGQTAYDYEVRFETAPEDAERVALAETFARETAGSGVDEARDGAWRWVEAWLRIPLLLEPTEERGWDDLASPVQAALRAMHTITPIAEVRCRALHSEPCDHPWHRWTEARQRTPSRAPDWGLGPDAIAVYTRQERYGALGETAPAVARAHRAASTP